jgi:hypothetical protein
MTTSAERKALNEGTFREANEQIEQGAVEIVGVDDGQFVPFLCECPRLECTQVALRSRSTSRFARQADRDWRCWVTRIPPSRKCSSGTSGSHEPRSSGALVRFTNRTTIAAMTDDRVRRVGENEALYRLVDERIERLRSGSATITSDFAVICECANLGCTTQIMIKSDVYERTRARSDHFIVLRGHQLDDLETIIEDHDTFVVIEKDPAEAKRIAEEMDPRS